MREPRGTARIRLHLQRAVVVHGQRLIERLSLTSAEEGIDNAGPEVPNSQPLFQDSRAQWLSASQRLCNGRHAKRISRRFGGEIASRTLRGDNLFSPAML